MPAKKAMAIAVDQFEEKFNKAFGAGALHKPKIIPYEVVSTGSLALDYATGVGGYVEGRLHEIWGIDDVGKTVLAILGMIQALKKHPDKLVAIIDMERKFDALYAQRLGLDLEKTLIYLPDSAEDVADAMKMMLESGRFSFIALDSIGAMIPKKEQEKSADESAMGKAPGIITRMVKIAGLYAERSGTVVIFINQVRANLSYGADTTTGGGFALKHSTTLKFKLKRTGTPPMKEKYDGDEIIVGREIAVQIERNKVASGSKEAIFTFFNRPSRFGPLGIDRADEAVTLGLKKDVQAIVQTGAWYTVASTGERLNGKEKLLESLRTQPELIEEIRKQSIATLKGEVVPVAESQINFEENDDTDD